MGCGLVVGHSATTCEALGLIPGTVLIVLGVGLRVRVYGRVFPIEMFHKNITCIKECSNIFTVSMFFLLRGLEVPLASVCFCGTQDSSWHSWDW